MVGIGIGLGGFMDGWNKMAESQRADRQVKLAEEAAARQKTLNQRQDAEYNRGLQQRNEIDAVNTGAKAEFDKRVSAGAEKPDNFDAFWSNYALPKLRNTYLAQGNLDMANRVQQWGESDDARAGAKLFMSSLSKFQLGDYDGAIDDAIAGSKRKGYLAHGYEFIGKDTLVATKGGPTIGYRIMFMDPDGKEGYRDIPLKQLPSFIAGIGNPVVAANSQMEAMSDASKREADIADYRTKKGIDKEFGNSDQQKRADAITALRKRMDGGLAGTEQKFDDLPRTEQEKLISDELALQRGTGIAVEAGNAPENKSSQRQVLMDKVTGRPVDPATVRGQTNAEPARPANPKTISKDAPASAETSRDANVAYVIAEADQAIKDGVRPDLIADGLRQNGIPSEQWPPALQRALARSQSGSVTGLNVR